MNKPKIVMRVQFGCYPDGNDIEMAFPIDETFVREVMEPIDNPFIDADPLVKEFICTRPDVIELVKSRREVFVKMVSERIAVALTDAVCARDTVMGYRS